MKECLEALSIFLCISGSNESLLVKSCGEEQQRDDRRGRSRRCGAATTMEIAITLSNLGNLEEVQ